MAEVGFSRSGARVGSGDRPAVAAALWPVVGGAEHAAVGVAAAGLYQHSIKSRIGEGEYLPVAPAALVEQLDLQVPKKLSTPALTPLVVPGHDPVCRSVVVKATLRRGTVPSWSKANALKAWLASCRYQSSNATSYWSPVVSASRLVTGARTLRATGPSAKGGKSRPRGRW
jgi:hypothetical protein